MVQIRFIEADGAIVQVEAEPGISLMEAARGAGVNGLVAECGGAGACGTCHVYVETGTKAAAALPPSTASEKDMLAVVLDPQPNSRLSCQILSAPPIDGLTVRVPEMQY